MGFSWKLSEKSHTHALLMYFKTLEYNFSQFYQHSIMLVAVNPPDIFHISLLNVVIVLHPIINSIDTTQPQFLFISIFHPTFFPTFLISWSWNRNENYFIRCTILSNGVSKLCFVSNYFRQFSTSFIQQEQFDSLRTSHPRSSQWNIGFFFY